MPVPWKVSDRGVEMSGFCVIGLCIVTYSCSINNHMTHVAFTSRKTHNIYVMCFLSTHNSEDGAVMWDVTALCSLKRYRSSQGTWCLSSCTWLVDFSSGTSVRTQSTLHHLPESAVSLLCIWNYRTKLIEINNFCAFKQYFKSYNCSNAPLSGRIRVSVNIQSTSRVVLSTLSCRAFWFILVNVRL